MIFAYNTDFNRPFIMKLISLNIWGGHLSKPLLQFIKDHKDVDIFCFQEVYHNAPEKVSTEDRENHLSIFSEIQKILDQHMGFFKPAVKGVYGLAAFVKKDIMVSREGDTTIHHNPDYPGLGPTHSRILQWLECLRDEKTYTILNVHGLWNGQGKNDCPERIQQSHHIKNFMNHLKTPYVLCGDFNLNPDTESLRSIADSAVDLIKTYDIKSTRSSFYTKQEQFADYLFTSPDVIINDFSVLPDEVSDHLPLLLDFI